MDWFLGETIMETDRGGGRWSVGEAQSGIIAGFVLRADELGSEKVSMRFKDLRGALDSMEVGKQIAPKTLSKALKALVARGRLARNQSGREVWYSLEKLPRQDLVPIITATHRAAILSAANLGAIGDLEQGWAFYGIPDLLRRRLRSSLREEAEAYRDRIAQLLEREVRRFIRSLLEKGRGRVTATELRDAERAIWLGLGEAHLVGAVSTILVYLDQVAPGAGGRTVSHAAAHWPSTREAQIRYIAQATGKEQTRIEREVMKIERLQTASRKLFGALPAADQKRFALEFNAWAQLIASWCAVVRT